MEEHIKNGNLIIDEKFIETIIDGKKERTEIELIDRLHIDYVGYEGKDYLNPNTFAVQKGLSNFINIYSVKKKMKIEVQIRKNDVYILNKIIQLWKASGVNISIKNEWGRNINELAL